MGDKSSMISPQKWSLRWLGVAVLCLVTGCGGPTAEDCNKAGREMYEKQRHKSALKQFQRAISKDGRKAKYHKNAGLCLMKMGKIDEALEAFRKGIRVDDDYGLAHKSLAILYAFKGRNKLALRHMKRAKELGTPVKRTLEDRLRPYDEE